LNKQEKVLFEWFSIEFQKKSGNLTFGMITTRKFQGNDCVMRASTIEHKRLLVIQKQGR